MALDNYSDIIDAENIEQSVVFNHSVYLTESFNKWIKAKNLSPRCFIIHPELVEQVSLNLFTDLQRIKDFHDIHEVNCRKFAAYQAAWILRLRPIQIIKLQSKSKKYVILANELFALQTVIAHMYDMIREKFLDANELKEWTAFLDKVVYHFHHRIINPQGLELTFEALGLAPPYMKT